LWADGPIQLAARPAPLLLISKGESVGLAVKPQQAVVAVLYGKDDVRKDCPGVRAGVELIKLFRQVDAAFFITQERKGGQRRFQQRIRVRRGGTLPAAEELPAGPFQARSRG
jgi:hypothetical protein